MDIRRRGRALTLTAGAGVPATAGTAAAAGPPSTADGASTVQLDGAAQAFVKAGSRIVVGGNFTYAGPLTGSASIVDAGTGARTAPQVRVLEGATNAAVPDGAGGAFLGGAGTATDADGAPHARLIHVLADGTVDPAFSGGLVSGEVRALALDAANHRLYVGGFRLQPEATDPEVSLLAVDTTTGAVLPAFAPPAFDDEVKALAFDPATGLYAGGPFTDVGGTPVKRIVRLNAATGALDSGFAAGVETEDYDAVTSLALDGTTLYVGGAFTGLIADGTTTPVTRRNAGAFSTAGAVLAFDPRPDSAVYAIAARAGAVYLAGDFRALSPGGSGSISRDLIARFGGGSSTPDAGWRPGIPDGAARLLAIAVDAGGGVLAGGVLDRARSTSGGVAERHGVVRLTAAGAVDASWTADSNGAVRALATDGTHAVVAGALTSTGGVPRHGLLAVDAGSGALDPGWDPQADEQVGALAVTPDGRRLFAAGLFNTVDGVATRVARLDPATGTPDPGFVVRPENRTGSVFVSGLAVTDTRVYFGGRFSSLSGAARQNLAAVAVDGDGSPLAFDAGTIDGDVVRLLADPAGGRLYAGGLFGTPRKGIAAFDLVTGALLPFDADLTSSTAQPPTVAALALGGDRLFVGGMFATARGATRNALAAVEPATGALVPAFTVQPGGTGSEVAGTCNRLVGGFAVLPTCTSALALTDDGTLLVGGTFDHLGPAARAGAGAVEGALGAAPAVGAWNPIVESRPLAELVSYGHRVLAGGVFGTLGYSSRFGGRDVAGMASFGLAVPSGVAAPSVDGVPHAGQVLTCRPGSWTDDPPAFAYRWLRDGSGITGAVASTYVVDAGADVGRALSCGVRATNAAGTSSEAVSAPVSASGAIAPASVAVPAVTGTPKPGGTLSCGDGTWSGDTPLTFARQWLRDDAPLAGQTSTTYAVTADDDGRTLRCRVTASNAGGAATAVSDGVGIGEAPVAGAVTPAITGPAGSPAPGDVLTCGHGDWTGSAPITFLYRWQRDGVAIDGATAADYTVTAADDGRALTCVVTARNAPGATSAVTGAVQPRRPRAPGAVAAPEVTGTALSGQVLSCSAGIWDGDGPQTFAYQWLLDDGPLPGATEPTYVVAPQDDGHVLTCRVTATNRVASVNAASAPRGVGTPPVNASPPAISGVAQQGQTLACAAGGWNGSQPQRYAFTWLRQGLPVGEGESYPVTETDVGLALVCRVVAVNVVGAATATSAPVTPDLPPPVRGVSANLEPRTGLVLVKRPGQPAFTTLALPRQVPVGTQVDTTRGRARVTSAATATRGGATQTAEFYDGPFGLTQTRTSPVTTLTLLGTPCGGAGAAAAKGRKPPGSVRLWGDGKGRFRTRGRWAVAGVRGTNWLTEDSCERTKVTVRRGVVAVTNLRTGKGTDVRAGDALTVRAP